MPKHFTGKHLLAAFGVGALSALTFRPCDRERFPCLALAEEVARSHPSYGVCMNAINDVMVDAYLNDIAGFYDISDEIKRGLDEFNPIALDTVEDVIALDKEIRQKATLRINAKW